MKLQISSVWDNEVTTLDAEVTEVDISKLVRERVDYYEVNDWKLDGDDIDHFWKFSLYLECEGFLLDKQDKSGVLSRTHRIEGAVSQVLRAEIFQVRAEIRALRAIHLSIPGYEIPRLSDFGRDKLN